MDCTNTDSGTLNPTEEVDHMTTGNVTGTGTGVFSPINMSSDFAGDSNEHMDNPLKLQATANEDQLVVPALPRSNASSSEWLALQPEQQDQSFSSLTSQPELGLADKNSSELFTAADIKSNPSWQTASVISLEKEPSHVDVTGDIHKQDKFLNQVDQMQTNFQTDVLQSQEPGCLEGHVEKHTLSTESIARLPQEIDGGNMTATGEPPASLVSTCIDSELHLSELASTTSASVGQPRTVHNTLGQYNNPQTSGIKSFEGKAHTKNSQCADGVEIKETNENSCTVSLDSYLSGYKGLLSKLSEMRKNTEPARPPDRAVAKVCAQPTRSRTKVTPKPKVKETRTGRPCVRSTRKLQNRVEAKGARQAVNKQREANEDLLPTNEVHRVQKALRDMITISKQGQEIVAGDGHTHFKQSGDGVEMTGTPLSDFDVRLKGLLNSSASSNIQESVVPQSSSDETAELRDTLGAERTRRKHCEDQIQGLHLKVLELQQELAIASSIDQKKDMMVKQLDQTMSQVANKWQQQQKEFEGQIGNLKTENSSLSQKNDELQKMLIEFENELRRAMMEFNTDRQRQEAERASLLNQLEESKRELAKQSLEVSDMQKSSMELDKAKGEVNKLREDFDKSARQNRELQLQVEELSERNQQTLQQGKAKAEAQSKLAAETKHVLSSVQQEVKRLELELDTAKRETEQLKLEMNLQTTRHENNLRRMEAEIQQKAEQQLLLRIEEAHQRLCQREQDLQEAHRKHVNEMCERHEQELGQQRDELHTQYTERVRQLQAHAEQMEQRFDESQREANRLQEQVKKSNRTRQQLGSQLETLMQSQFAQAVSLLHSGLEQSPEKAKPFTPFSSLPVAGYTEKLNPLPRAQSADGDLLLTTESRDEAAGFAACETEVPDLTERSKAELPKPVWKSKATNSADTKTSTNIHPKQQQRSRPPISFPLTSSHMAASSGDNNSFSSQHSSIAPSLHLFDLSSASGRQNGNSDERNAIDAISPIRGDADHNAMTRSSEMRSLPLHSTAQSHQLVDNGRPELSELLKLQEVQAERLQNLRMQLSWDAQNAGATAEATIKRTDVPRISAVDNTLPTVNAAVSLGIKHERSQADRSAAANTDDDTLSLQSERLDYGGIQNRIDEHQSRQLELSHYIQMLLKSPTDSNTQLNAPVKGISHANEDKDFHPTQKQGEISRLLDKFEETKSIDDMLNYIQAHNRPAQLAPQSSTPVGGSPVVDRHKPVLTETRSKSADRACVERRPLHPQVIKKTAEANHRPLSTVSPRDAPKEASTSEAVGNSESFAPRGRSKSTSKQTTASSRAKASKPIEKKDKRTVSAKRKSNIWK